MHQKTSMKQSKEKDDFLLQNQLGIDLDRGKSVILANMNSKRPLASSIFLDRKDEVFKNQIKLSPNRDKFYQKNRQELLNRTKSLKQIENVQKGTKSEYGGDQQPHQLGENLAKLKAQQLAFKIKSRVVSLLKQMQFGVSDLSKLTQIGRAEEAIDFLQQKIRQRLRLAQISEKGVINIREKQKEQLSELNQQIVKLKKHLEQRQNSQKLYRGKLKEAGAQIRSLYDKLNQRERQITTKSTQVYQAKVLSKENERLLEVLQTRLKTAEKDRSQMREQIQNVNRGNRSMIKDLTEQISKAKQERQVIQEELERVLARQSRLNHANQQLSEEVARWRQRFAWLQKQKSTEVKALVDEHMRTSTATQQASGSQASNHDQDSYRLIERINELERQKRDLQKQLLNFAAIRDRFGSALFGKFQNKLEQFNQIGISQLELVYQRKTEKFATEWRDKMIETVDSYENQLQILRRQKDILAAQKQQLTRMVVQVANEKYQVERKLLSRQDEIQIISKKNKSQNKFPSVQLLKESLKIDLHDKKTEIVSNKIIKLNDNDDKECKNELNAKQLQKNLQEKAEDIKKTQKTQSKVDNPNDIQLLEVRSSIESISLKTD